MQIYDDFLSKTILNDNEIEVLKRYLRGDTIVKIANDTSQSTATVSRMIASIKLKYKKYKELELAKLIIFQKEN